MLTYDIIGNMPIAQSIAHGHFAIGLGTIALCGFVSEIFSPKDY